MPERPEAHEIDYARNLPARKKPRPRTVLWSLIFLLSTFIVLFQPAWIYESHGAWKTMRIGIFGRVFGVSTLMEESPTGPLPPLVQHNFIGFSYANGIMQVSGLRAAGLAITEQWRVTYVAVPVWLTMVISALILLLTFNLPRRLVLVFKEKKKGQKSIDQWHG